MAIKQLSIYLENKQGTLAGLLNELADSNIDLRAVCLADTINFGICRVIVDDIEKACKIIEEAGYTCNVREICAFAIPDAPGSLAKVLSLFSENDISVEYMYSIISNELGKVCCVVRIGNNENEKAEKILKENSIEIIESLGE